MPDVSDSVQPHPSYGFYTSEEVRMLLDLCPLKNHEEVGKIYDAAAARRRKHRAKERRNEKQRAATARQTIEA